MTIEAPFVCLMGGAGSGKTYSIPTVLQSEGIDELCVVGTEPRFTESLIDSCMARGIDRSRLHYAHVYPRTASWEAMYDVAEKVSMLDYSGVTKQAYSKKGYDQWLDLLTLLSNYKCECCQREFGPVDDFPASRALAIDSTTGICRLAKDLTVGPKPVLHEGEWGVAMAPVEGLMNKLASSCPGLVIVTAHVERRDDLISGASQVTAMTIGRQLTPKILPLFSDVIHCVRDGSSFYWSTMTPQYDLKKRNLSFAADLEPHFGQLIDNYRKRLPPTSPGDKQDALPEK